MEQSGGNAPRYFELYVMGTNLSDRGIWQKAAVPAQVLLSRNEPAAWILESRKVSKRIAKQLNRLPLGEITIEEYMKMYTPAQP